MSINVDEKKLSLGRWHLDSFNKQIKVFTFLNDVDDRNGPFEMLPKTHKKIFKISHIFSAKLLQLRDIINRSGDRSYQKIDEKIVEKLNKKGYALKSFTVPAGTIAIVDTSCMHRARPNLKGTRYALTSYYK